MSGSFNMELCCTCVIFILSFTHLNDEDYSTMHLTPYVTISMCEQEGPVCHISVFAKNIIIGLT